MDIKTFQELSVRTMNQELTKEQKMTNCMMGIMGEAGEVADIIKKALYQGHELDFEHLHEELGDVMFYIVNLATTLGFNMEDILEGNIDKLRRRYPAGFSAAASINRAE